MILEMKLAQVHGRFPGQSNYIFFPQCSMFTHERCIIYMYTVWEQLLLCEQGLGENNVLRGHIVCILFICILFLFFIYLFQSTKTILLILSNSCE
mmetsp:Transcript_80419/g.157811  ORF Transcript_80419/g.157811 Transcript_80419/m.157811 type:complete len:95 (+) Transcript_80419:996-1280(+)